MTTGKNIGGFTGGPKPVLDENNHVIGESDVEYHSFSEGEKEVSEKMSGTVPDRIEFKVNVEGLTIDQAIEKVEHHKEAYEKFVKEMADEYKEERVEGVISAPVPKVLDPQDFKHIEPIPFTPSLPMDEYLDPGRTNQMYILANTYFKSECFTKDCKNVEQVFLKIQAGRELGLTPVESMNDLYILHGNVTLWGSGLAKRFKRFGYKIEFKDEISNFDYTSSRGVKGSSADYKYDSPQSMPSVEKRKLQDSKGEDQVTVVVTKKDDPEESYEYTVMLSEVEALKSNALKIARKDKLRYHGLARIARFNLPEILGAVHYIAEEISHDMAPPILDKVEAGKAKKEALRNKKK